jgi:hypothetical protein
MRIIEGRKREKIQQEKIARYEEKRHSELMAEFAKIPSFIWVPASSDAVKRILQDVPD